MAMTEQYRKWISELLAKYAAGWPSTEEVESQLVLDQERDHYLWLRVGWKESEPIYHNIIHCDIKKGKIWLQRNMTDQDLAEDLVELGVPREDIVLGFQPGYARPYTDYGVG